MQNRDLLLQLEKLQEYYNHKLNPTQLDVWLDALEHISPPRLDAMFKKCIATNKWFPKVSEFLEIQVEDEFGINQEFECVLHEDLQWIEHVLGWEEG